MNNIRIHVMHTGKVCVSSNVPFGGEKCSPAKAMGLFEGKEKRIWLPVSSYLIEHPKGTVLVDTGWHRDMSPNGVIDKAAQIRSLGSRLLYLANQGVVPPGEAVDEQLAAMGIAPADLDCVLLTHLDCDHANGLRAVSGAKRILASQDEIDSVRRGVAARVRYQSRWWEGTGIEFFNWNGTEGPFRRSFDLFGDGSIVCVAIPGHADGLFAVKVTGEDGHFVLLCSDGAYGRRSWEEMIVSGIANDRAAQRRSLEWIREESRDPMCMELIANHDTEVLPHDINL